MFVEARQDGSWHWNWVWEAWGQFGSAAQYLCDLETGFHSFVSVRMRIFPFSVLQGYEDPFTMSVRCLDNVKS